MLEIKLQFIANPDEMFRFVLNQYAWLAMHIIPFTLGKKTRYAVCINRFAFKN